MGTSGVLTKADAGISVVAPAILNNGANIFSFGGVQPRGVDVESGTLVFKGAVSGTGSDNIDGQGSNNFLTATTLEFDNSVGAGQTVNFFGPPGAALYLTDLPDFHAGVTGFDGINGGNSLLISGGYSLPARARRRQRRPSRFPKQVRPRRR